MRRKRRAADWDEGSIYDRPNYRGKRRIAAAIVLNGMAPAYEFSPVLSTPSRVQHSSQMPA
jgi:hypothetical protein